MSATIIGTVTPTTANNTDASFRAWGSALSAAIAAAGWVQTADTGQINWATIGRSITTNTPASYEIWRANDSLQATQPLFLKIEYGSAGAVGIPSIWVTVGTATDGAGNLGSMAGTGISVTARRAVNPTNTNDTAAPSSATPLYVNGDSSSLLIGFFPNTSSWGGGVFCIERTRDWSGAVNSDGFIVINGNIGNFSGSLGQHQVIYFNTNIPQPALISQLPGIAVNATLTTVVVNNTLYPLPILPSFGGKIEGPMMFLMATQKNDVGAGSTFTMNHYGSSHTWYGSGGGLAGATNGYSAYGGVSTATLTGTSLIMRMD